MLRRLHPVQPASFAFTPANLVWAEGQISKYPAGRQASAIIPILWRAQEQEGWLSRPAIEHVASMLDLAYIRALEVATFYFMFQLQPVGSLGHIQICGTTSCMICGAEELIAVCKEMISQAPHVLSADGKFSWEEVECLGACANAPMAQIGKDYYEDLTAPKLRDLISRFSEGEMPLPGPQNGRFAAEPITGLTSLTEYAAGRMAHNGSVGAAVALMDTVRRIDGTEVPLRTPWLQQAAAAPIPSSAANNDPKPSAGRAADASGVTVQEATAHSVGKPVAQGDAANATPAATPEAKATPEKIAPMPEGQHQQPARLPSPREGKADDLKRILGIGPKLAILCNALGVYHFDQIAGWSATEIAWVDDNLEGFKGRATRDKWVAQAKVLAAGGSAEDVERAARGEDGN